MNLVKTCTLIGIFLLPGCASVAQQQAERDQEVRNEVRKCEALHAEDGAWSERASACMFDLTAKYDLPVKCTALYMAGKTLESQLCTAEVNEGIKAAYNARKAAYEDYDYQHRGENAERVSRSLSAFGNSMRADPAPAAPSTRAPTCTTMSHYDGFGRLITEQDCR